MNPVSALALALLAATALAQDPGLDRSLDVIHKPAAVSIGFRDIDLIKARFQALRAAVSLLDAQGRAVESCAVDFTHEATPSHVVFRKDGRSVYATVSVRVSDGDRVLMEKSVPLPRPVESAVAPQLAETAHLEPGTAFDAGSAPTVPLLDLARVQAATLAEPAREVAAEACKRRVVAELNFPSASGTALISRQTAAPDDPARRSFYIPCSSELYDPATGAYESTLKYLIEIPIDPAWLATGGDAAVQASPDDIRVHITADKINVTRQGERRLTGQEKGLLGQTVNSCGVADDGSLYFALQYAGPIRFNVRKAKWEAPPVNLYEWLEARLPKPEDLPYPKGEVSDVRIDPSNCIYAFNGRVYLLPTRYMQVGKTSSGGNSLFNAAVLSIPMEHWDDKDAFANAIRLNAVSWPGTPISLWSTHVERNDHQRKLNLMMPAGNRLLFTAYHYNYFWILDLADDGSTRRLTPAPTFAGKRIAQITHGGYWLQRGADILGIQMQIALEGEPKPRDVFLAMDATEFTDQIPKQCQRLLHYQFSGQIPIVENKESSYGCYLALKRSVQHALGLPRADGLLSIYYDALGRMKKHPGPHRELIDRMSAASMGPEYYLVPAPGAMEILGTSDYPIYNFARYDCSAPATVSRKTHLFRKAAGLDVRLNAPARLGLYCHQWFREGGDDVLYYAGYTGIARLRYRVRGRVPEFHEPELLRYKLKQESLDASPMGELKWVRDVCPGLADRVHFTGVSAASRGGTAYSGGLAYLHRGKADALYRLTRMSRAYKNTRLASRLTVAGGRLEQDLFLLGNHDSHDANTIPEADRPKNTQPRVFLYRDNGVDRVRDLFGFTLAPAQAKDQSVAAVAVSANGLFLVVALADGTLATLDLDTWRYAHALRLPTAPGLIQVPDGALLASIAPAESEAADQAEAPPRCRTYYLVHVDPAGLLSLTPTLKLTIPAALQFGRSALLFDYERRDGSYDLVLGPSFRTPESALWIVRDVVPPRP